MAFDIVMAKTIIGKRVAKEFKDGQLIYVGAGLPSCAINFVPENVKLSIISESGLIGVLNPKSRKLSVITGGCYMDSSSSFGLIRGGHVDIAVMNAIEVDESGSFASWIVPGKKVPGMAGEMEVAVGAKKVITTLYHKEDGSSRIKRVCTLPITARNEVNMIVTEMGVFEVGKNFMTLMEINPQISIDEITMATDADFKVSDRLSFMEV